MITRSAGYDAVVAELKDRFGERRPTDAAAIRERAEAEAEAFRIVADHQATMVRTMFQTASINIRGKGEAIKEVVEAIGNFGKEAKSAVESADGEVASSAGQAVSAKDAALNPTEVGKHHASELTGLAAAEFSELARDLGTEVLTDLGASLIPVIGQVKNGGQAIQKWANVAREQHLIRQTERANERAVREGDPQVAIQAVCRLFQRERNRLAMEASIKTTKFGASVAGSFVDLGAGTNAAISLTAAAVELTQKLYTLGRDYSEVRAAREALDKEQYNAELFRICPLLGAYMVTCTDTSYLVGMLSGPKRSVTVNEMEKIIRKHIHPVQKESRLLIERSRFRVDGLPSDKGKFVGQSDRGMVDRLKMKIKQSAKKTAKSAVSAAKKKIAQAT